MGGGGDLKGWAIEIRDWALITGRGEGYKMGKSQVRNFLRPPPQDRVKLFVPAILKDGNILRPPFSMATA